jgi:serine/threonine protein kinase
MCHLDVKPGNVLINDDGEATLIDFGIAKVFGSDGQALTDSPVTYTTHYAPLEQYQGLSDFSPQTDLYSLGATLYYLVTGQNPPLAGEVNEEGLTQKPAEVSDQVWRAIVAAMQPRRKDRPASIDIWMKMLDGIGKPLSLNNDDETVITMNSQQAMNSEETVISRKPAVDSAETVISGSARPSSSGYQQPGRPQPQPAKPQGAKPTGGKPFQPQPQKGGFNKKWLLLIPVVLVFLLVLLGGIGYGAYWYYTNHYADEEMIIETETGYSTSEAIEILDGLNLSLSRIQEVERTVYHDGTTEQEEIFERRVKALKHIYTECFLTEDHSVQRLQGVYMLRSTDLSYYQMEVLRWFFNLPASQQRQLEYLQGSIENFTDFREKVEAEIANSQNNH